MKNSNKLDNITLRDYNELIDLSSYKLTPLQAIKLKCKECCGFNSFEVKQCNITTCALHQFINNKNIYNITEEERERRKKLLTTK